MENIWAMHDGHVDARKRKKNKKLRKKREEDEQV
jgi:hypothetical protein